MSRLDCNYTAKSLDVSRCHKNDYSGEFQLKKRKKEKEKKKKKERKQKKKKKSNKN